MAEKAKNVEVTQCERGAKIFITTFEDGSKEISCENLRLNFIYRHPWLKCVVLGDEERKWQVCIYDQDWKSGKIKVPYPQAQG